MHIYRYMCIKNKLQITVHKIFKRIDNCMTKTSIIKYCTCLSIILALLSPVMKHLDYFLLI